MQNLIITNKGQELMAKLIAGTSTAEFTKICTSDFDYTGEVLEELLDLYQIKQTTLVSKVTRTDTTVVEVLGAMNNAELNEGYYIRGVGLYAKDSDNTEILYAVSVSSTPDYMPPFSGQTVSGVSFRLNTKVDNASQVVLEVDPAATPTVEQLNEVVHVVEVHAAASVHSEVGVHGFRFYNDVLQFINDEGEWIDIETGGGGVAPSNVIDPRIKVGNQKLTLYWSDPGDTVIEGQTICTWAGTKLVQKAGSFPTNVKDGTVVLDNKVKDTYKDDGYEINGLTNGVTYYFQLFPYSDKNAVNENIINRLSAAPQPFRIMTVKIDLTNSNPATAITYHDDAADMTPGSAAWDEFFGHRPCLFKNGAVVGYLKPDNFNQFEDGSAAEIKSGSAGDAMVEFPRRGLKISTVGNIMTIKMTDDPDNTDFEYQAHTRGTSRRENFYLGVYKSSNISSKMRSLKEKTIQATQTIGTFRTQAQNNGDGYENSGFYQLTFRQVMFILKYKTLDSQSAVGRGYVDSNSAAIATGGTETWGMDSELIKVTNPGYMTDGKHHVKCFGLEDFWGNIWEWIDGIVTNSTINMLVGNDNFNDAGSGYENQGQGASSDINGYMSKPQGTTKTGFLAKEVSGSETTYFCDSAALSDSCVAFFGGSWINASNAGAFRLTVNDAASYSAASLAARLMYL